MRVEHMVLRVASLLAPAAQRAEWLAEWSGEVCWAIRESKRPLRFALGAFPDVVWLRRNQPRAAARQWLHSPVDCAILLGALAVLAAIGMAVASAAPDARPRPPALAHFNILVFSIVLLPVTTTLALGAVPAGVAPFRRWIFLTFKIACLIVIVFCGGMGGSIIAGAGPIQPHGQIIGYILAFRWALRDQRNRCPDCLRRLTSPTSFGTPSQLLLEWYGTELICPRGHGLMHVPEIADSSYGGQYWMRLDSSWKSLFTSPLHR